MENDERTPVGRYSQSLHVISAFLVAYAAVVCQMYSSNAAPARPASESLTDRLALMDYEARRLLSAIVKNVVQMTAEDLEPTSDDSSQGRFLSKRCSNLSTCVLGKLSQELHKLQTFPQTDVGAGTPGKKRSLLEGNQFTSYEETVTAQKRACNTATCVTHRLADFLSRSGGMGNSNFVPTNVGSQAFGRRRRNSRICEVGADWFSVGDNRTTTATEIVSLSQRYSRP
ncbi:Calcitonin-1 [Labeo rohita]|uniref:Calcitonin-1 n=1 Tax=Labeo rohita TaxID=84645 RepID=A0ABQ8L293_LABRO|nr:Calcitonin-1 [Labeo rohita]